MIRYEAKYLRISDFSVLWRGINSRIMVIKAYFDGSCTLHDPKCTHITLAGFSATKEQWDMFEPIWDSVLVKHNAPLSKRGNPYWHSSEAFHLREGYEGWHEDQVENLALELFQVLNKMPLDSLHGFAATVRKADYEKIKRENPKLMHPHVLCLEHCFSAIIGRAETASSEPLLELVFDENEPFEPIINRCLKHRIWWREYIGDRMRTNRMCNLYPLQLCDLLAWLLNRYHSSRTENKDEWHEMARCLIEECYRRF